MKNDTRLPTQMDWLCTVEFIPEDDEEARLFATEIIGHLFGYAQATNTRALALVGDADANAYELLFSFASSEGKEQFLHLVRTNDDMENDYIENDFMSPTAEEIRNARPSDGPAAGCCQPCRPDCGNSLCVARGQSLGILNSRHWSLPLE
jgi:hypothetical protein